jgi:hypothetical protein
MANRLTQPGQRASGVETEVSQVIARESSIMLTLSVKRPCAGGFSREHAVHQVLSMRKGLITDIRDYSTRGEEVSPTVGSLGDVPGITARQVIPILNDPVIARFCSLSTGRVVAGSRNSRGSATRLHKTR